MSAPNPLLDLGLRIPFHQIQAAHVEPAIDALIEQVRAGVAAIAEDTSPPTYDNVLEALENVSEPLERAMGVVGHLESVATTDALRAAYNVVKPRVSELYSSIAMDAKLYARLVAFSSTDEAAALSPTKRRFLDKELRSFRRNGADLDEAGKEKLTALDVELSKLTTKFAQNLLDETNAFELLIEDEAGLAGLPESAIGAAKASAESKGLSGWRFTLQAPSIFPVLTYLDDAAVRQTMWRAYNTRASAGERDNRPLIERIIELRNARAELLGYESFVAYVLEERMAKRADTARGFLADLRERARPFFEREQEALASFRRELEGDDAADLEPWDVSYYAEKLRKARFDYDAEALRPYFSADRVMSGLFSVVERLYGVTVEQDHDVPVWNDDVRTYRLLEGDTLRGAFYVDLHPREDKRGGAWMNSFVTGGPGYGPHVGLFCANATAPVGDAPALLTHGEVQTLFHEFGHLMHHLLSDVEVRSLAGTNVAWDFVELPSQIMENWSWEREALDLFARHHETDEPIPDALFDKLVRARTFRAASGMMRQLGFATADLALHLDYDPAGDGDAVSFARAVMEPFAPTELPDDYAMICGFGHLFHGAVGYAAGYYSYKWAEVLDADAFSRFAERGIFDTEVGDELRRKILSRGNSAEPEELFRDFMGRDPSVDALLARSGLVAAS